MDEDHDLGRRLCQPGTQILGPRCLAQEPEVVHLRSVRGGQRRPALAELARGHDEHGISRREKVHDRRLEAAGARCRKDKDVVPGPEDFLKAAEAP